MVNVGLCHRGSRMKKKEKLWWLCLFLAVFIALPHSVSGKRKPLLGLIEAPKGEGKRYVTAEEGQMFRGSGGYEDEVWLTEAEDKTLYIEVPEGRRMITLGVNVIVQAEVTFDLTKGDYRYHYALHNLKTSPGEASDFEVVFDPSLPFSDFTAPQTKPNPWDAWGRWKEEYPEFWERSERPLRWSGTLSMGESLGGFSFRSPVLPGIVHCWSSVMIPHSGGVFLGGKTLGPVASPDPFDSQKFLERLSSIIDESLKEGWIEDGNVAQNLKKRLESARGTVESGDKKRLESALRDLLKKVEEKDGSLLSEAYALLKYNVQYWLDQLK